MAMPRNLSVKTVVALVIACAKLHNFCIGETNIQEQIPQMLDRDRFLMMNAHSGYVGPHNDDPQQHTTAVPTDLMHLDEHFNDVPNNLLRLHHRLNAGSELPWTCLFNMIVDGHWQRPTRVIHAGR